MMNRLPLKGGVCFGRRIIIKRKKRNKAKKICTEKKDRKNVRKQSKGSDSQMAYACKI